MGATTLLCVTYALGLLLWQALRFTPLAHWWLFELLDIFALGLFAPLPLLALAGLLSGDRAAGRWLLVPLALFAWEYGDLFLPQRAPSEGRPLRVLTANVLVTNGQHAQVVGLLQMESADVVALQELSPGMADHLARALRSEYPYQLLAPSGTPFGLGVLSRYPIRDTLDGMGWHSHVCACQRVEITVDGRMVTLLNVHPPPPSVSAGWLGPFPVPSGFDPARTNRPLDAALDGIDTEAGPLLVVGDFNTSDRQPKYRALRRNLLDAHREAGWGFGNSFPARSLGGLPELGLIRIDYILHNRAVATRAASTGATPGSDHHHVIADVLLP